MSLFFTDVYGSQQVWKIEIFVLNKVLFYSLQILHKIEVQFCVLDILREAE